ncbi:MAG: hypothetical protein U0V87_16805 [Acidobacteriota bacterium]
MKNADTRTLLFGIFVSAGGKLTAGQVIALAAPLGISASNVKSHLTRLVQEGALDRSGPTRQAEYAPTKSQCGVVEGITARLQQHRAPEPWNGAWIMLTPRVTGSRGEREWLRASLWFDGFRATPHTTSPGTYLRPAWPRAWAIGRARQYPGICVVGALLEPLGFVLLDKMYELDEFDRQARKLADWIGRRPIPRDPGRAFAEQLKTGSRVTRLISHDPRLPAVLWGQRTGLAELVDAWVRFEARIASKAGQFVADVMASS